MSMSTFVLGMAFVAAACVSALQPPASVEVHSTLGGTGTCVATQVSHFRVSLHNPAVVICGTDGNSYNASVYALDLISSVCGIGVVSVGTCHCPNNCTGGSRGHCAADGSQCLCDMGWGGRDCNSPVCPDSDCGGHGQCSSSTADAVCECEPLWTGPDCTVPALAANATDMPWGCVLPPVHRSDRSACAPPVGDLPWLEFSTLAQVRLTMDASSWSHLMDPAQMWNATYQRMNFTYVSNSNHTVTTFVDAGIRLKGCTSRQFPKKSFNVDFKHATSPVEGSHHHHHRRHGWPKKLSLKASQAFLGAQLTTSALLTAGMPVQRTSFALLYVNDVYQGVYFLMEKFSNKFVRFYFGENATKDEYHLGLSGRGGNFWQAVHNSTFKPEFAVNSTYTRFCYWLASAPDAEFNSDFASRFDTESYARAIAVESFVVMGDSLVEGTNFQVYQSASVPLSVSVRDFDMALFLQGQPDVFTWATEVMVSHPLGTRAFNNTAFVAVYCAAYRALLGAWTSPGAHMSTWYTSFVPLLDQWLAHDMMDAVSTGRPRNHHLVEYAARDAAWLQARLPAVQAQLNARCPSP
jgi:hypothetical protein